MPPLAATFQSVAASTGQALTTITVTFNRAVRGVTLDDFVLTRGTVTASLAGARIMSRDGRTFTITGLSGTAAAGSYRLRLKSAGTGIVDAAGTAISGSPRISWTMPARAPAAVSRETLPRG